jgi:glycosyltransferase involved in cell wall biosynthesis
MLIFNAMFGANMGGLEQVFVDYTEALMSVGVSVISLTKPNAAVIPLLEEINAPHFQVPNFNQYDPRAVLRVRKLLKDHNSSAIIAHGNRAINISRYAALGVCPFVAVNHSINIKRSVNADAVIAINEDMRGRLIASGVDAAKVFKLFNMIKKPSGFNRKPVQFRNPPIIAAIGRFTQKKRFDKFIETLLILDGEGVSFQAILAGDGELRQSLADKASSLLSNGKLQMPGWVQDKQSFYDGIDIFCFTSEHDVCPIVLLEAYLYGKPVVMTNPPGPLEIATAGVDAEIVAINNEAQLAGALKKLINNPDYAYALGESAHLKAMQNFTMQTSALRLKEIMERVIDSRHSKT